MDFSEAVKLTKVEKMLELRFASDPRGSRFALPEVPKDFQEKFPGEPYTVPMTITPEMARDWIEYRMIRKQITPKELLHKDFCPNRRILIGALTGSSHRKGWVDTIRDGELKMHHQGVAFTEDGFLCDGQHRLIGCALAKKPIRIQVSVNVDWRSFSVMDSGRARSAGQMLGDLPHADMCAAAARYILPVLNDAERAEFYDPLASKQTVIDLVEGWGLFHGPWTKEVSMASHHSNVPNTLLMATVMMALAAGGDAVTDDVQQFLNGLKKTFKPRDYITIGTDGEDPRWILRNTFSNQGKGKRSFSSDETYGNVGLVRRAMTIWLDKERVLTLSRTPRNRALPPVWNADAVRKFHADHVIN